VKILVLGATGFVGRAIVPALLSAGENVRAASRHPRRGATGGADWVKCDVRDRNTLVPALDGIDCIYYLVHSMGEGAGDFREVERQSAHALAEAAAESACRRIVYLGGVQPRGHPSTHLASRLEVGAILRAGKVPALAPTHHPSELRPGS
jgi:uncharacterized protein YbjT (DUF2867 family)